MTPREIHDKIKRLWPKSVAAGEDWAAEYMAVLGKFTGPKLDDAWQKWMDNPDHPHPPQPSELAKFCRTTGSYRDGVEPWRTSPPELPQTYPMSPETLRNVQADLDQINRRLNSENPGIPVKLLEQLKSIGEGHLNRHSKAMGRQ